MCRSVTPREAAHRDVDEAVGDDLAERSEQAALDFIDALEQADGHIGRHPATGAPRDAHELDLPGLRVWPLRRDPYRVFYDTQNTSNRSYVNM